MRDVGGEGEAGGGDCRAVVDLVTFYGGGKLSPLSEVVWWRLVGAYGCSKLLQSLCKVRGVRGAKYDRMLEWGSLLMFVQALLVPHEVTTREYQLHM